MPNVISVKTHKELVDTNQLVVHMKERVYKDRKTPVQVHPTCDVCQLVLTPKKKHLCHSAYRCVCLTCEKAFKRPDHLVRYRQAEHEGKRWNCEKSDKFFKRPDSMKKHMKKNCKKMISLLLKQLSNLLHFLIDSSLCCYFN